MDKERDFVSFCQLMNATADITATQPKTKHALGLMFMLLSKYDLATIQRTVQEYLTSAGGKFFPTPSQLIEIIDGSPDDRAALAWQTVRRAVEKYSGYESVRFNDPAIHYAIQHLGGWVRVNNDFQEKTERDIEFYGKDFKEIYAIGYRTANWNNVPAYFQGTIEHDNRVGGYIDFIPKVNMVGSGEKVKQELLEELNGCAVGYGDETCQSNKTLRLMK